MFTRELPARTGALGDQIEGEKLNFNKMALQIIDQDTPLEVKGIVTVLYGIPGVGKTSLAFTSKNPFLLPFRLSALITESAM